MAALIQSRYGTDAKRIAVIHRAFDPARFGGDGIDEERIAAMRALLKTGPDDRIVLLAGRITRRKAQADLVEAMGILQRRGLDGFICVLAGEVEKAGYFDELMQTARDAGVAQRIRTPGNVSDMPALYRISDVVLNISRAEGLPRVALEAQAMGTPVIVADTGPGREVARTPPDVTADQSTGLRVPYGDADSLAGALAQIISMPPEERRAMGMRGQEFVTGKFSLARLTSDTLRVYSDVLTEHAET